MLLLDIGYSLIMIKYTEKDKIIKSHTSRTKEPLDANHIDMMGSHDVLKM